MNYLRYVYLLTAVWIVHCQTPEPSPCYQVANGQKQTVANCTANANVPKEQRFQTKEEAEKYMVTQPVSVCPTWILEVASE